MPSMPTDRDKLVSIIYDFQAAAVSANLDYDNRPMLQFVDSDLAYEIVSTMPFAMVRRCEYNHGPYRYIPVAEITTESYRIKAAGRLIEQVGEFS